MTAMNGEWLSTTGNNNSNNNNNNHNTNSHTNNNDQSFLGANQSSSSSSSETAAAAAAAARVGESSQDQLQVQEQQCRSTSGSGSNSDGETTAAATTTTTDTYGTAEGVEKRIIKQERTTEQLQDTATASTANSSSNTECFTNPSKKKHPTTKTKLVSSAGGNSSNKINSNTIRDVHQDHLRRQTAPITVTPLPPPSSYSSAAATTTSSSSQQQQQQQQQQPWSTSSRGDTTSGVSPVSSPSALSRNTGRSTTRLLPRRLIPSSIMSRLVSTSSSTTAAASNNNQNTYYNHESSTNNNPTPDTTINHWIQQQPPQPQPPQQGGSSWTIVSTDTRASGEGSPPCARSLHSAAVIGDVLYVFGGYDGQSRLNDFHSFSFLEMRWSPIIPVDSTSSPSPRDRHVSVAYNDTFYVFGGFDGRSRVNDFYGYNTMTHHWQCIDAGTTATTTTTTTATTALSTPPSPRHSHSAVVYGHSMYVFGGYDGSYRCDITQFHFLDRQWITLPTVGRSPRPRYRATCVTVPSRHLMILFGGHDGTRHLADTHIFDFFTNAWSLLSPIESPSSLPLPRDSHVAVLVEPHETLVVSSPSTTATTTTTTTNIAIMYVFGGSTGSAMNDLFKLTMEFTEETANNNTNNNANVISSAKWSQIVHPTDSSSIPRNRFCHVGVCYRDSLYVFGGYDGTSRLNDFLCYDFEDFTRVDESYLNFVAAAAGTGNGTLATTAHPNTYLDFLPLPDYLQNFLNQSELSDVTFIVEGVPVFAHKLLLVRSSYFRAMFLGPTTTIEGQQELRFKEASQKEITFDHVRLPIFLLLLTFLYTDRCAGLTTNTSKVPASTATIVSLEDTMDLFVAADEFCVPRLKLICEKKIVSSLSIENAASIFLAADIFTAEELKRKTLKFILNHFEQVSKTITFEEMARSNVDLVLEILRKRS